MEFWFAPSKAKRKLDWEIYPGPFLGKRWPLTPWKILPSSSRTFLLASTPDGILGNPNFFNLDSNAGQTFRCAASYSASLPAFIRNRKATLGNRTSRLFPIQVLHDRQEYMAYGKASTPTEKPWIINFSEASLVEAGG